MYRDGNSRRTSDLSDRIYKSAGRKIDNMSDSKKTYLKRINFRLTWSCSDSEDETLASSEDV